MCGLLGIVAKAPVNQEIFDGLTILQHRGQDAAGIATHAKNRFFLQKGNGLVRDVFEKENILKLVGNMGIGHVRYPTAGSSQAQEAQPFYVNSPYGITLAHNGNLINTEQLKIQLFHEDFRHINTDSDSEIILNIFASELQKLATVPLNAYDVANALRKVFTKCQGAYSVVLMIAGVGMVAFRDPYGIRPLIYGERKHTLGLEYMVSSESVALSSLGFSNFKDILPGEAIFISEQGEKEVIQCVPAKYYAPCVFEYIYFARPDSIMDGISVYDARVRMGEKLANRILENHFGNEIDVVIPIPETSRSSALAMARVLNVPYREGFVKNRYIGRTFIMSGQNLRRHSVRQKLNILNIEFAGKNVLLVDDSIVRGTTSKEIIQMAHEAGAKKVYFASIAPKVIYPNVYGIDMPDQKDLVASQFDDEQLCKILGADKLFFQTLPDLINVMLECNPNLKQFDTSIFDGQYITGGVTEDYLLHLEELRSEKQTEKLIVE